ncbi:MAG TPA: metallophosphoesterase [Solirubrobacterales bacterium]|nr:metallophosphoesterase [Solirubrobacterales bacterium]
MATFRAHFEPFLQLADVGDDEALIAWGGFYFRRGDSTYGDWRIVDDEELDQVAGHRSETIGAGSEPFGNAVVEVEREGRVVARAETADANHVWVRGLEPDTEYSYRVLVDGEPWADGERCDWDLDRRTLIRAGRSYENRFRTFPARDTPAPVRFAVLGDFGVGILDPGPGGARQLRLAGALDRLVSENRVRLVLTTGDNIYLGAEGTVSGTGNEDDDWYASFYQPYRYVINRVPFFPTVGNHDAADTERSDDRDQLADNYFLDHRFRREIDAGRASLDPGLFYRFGVGASVEFICIDTSIAADAEGDHYFDAPSHREWVREALRRSADGTPLWRIPFSHHPPFCAGPEHPCTAGMIERLVPLFERAGVRIVLSGHEHNFQYSLVNGIHYVVSGAGGKLRTERPTAFTAAGTRAWGAEGHFLVVDLDPARVLIHPVRDVRDGGALDPIELRDPGGSPVATPIEVEPDR